MGCSRKKNIKIGENMTIPFSNNPLPKDINEVKYNIVDVHHSEKKNMIDYLLNKGYKLLADSMYKDERF